MVRATGKKRAIFSMHSTVLSDVLNENFSTRLWKTHTVSWMGKVFLATS
jgi:hypothetical protein